MNTNTNLQGLTAMNSNAPFNLNTKTRNANLKSNTNMFRQTALAAAVCLALSGTSPAVFALSNTNAQTDAYAGVEGARAAAAVGDANVGASASGSATATNEEGSLSSTNAAAAAAVLDASNGARQSTAVFTPISSSNDDTDGPELSDGASSTVSATASNANTASTAAAAASESRSTLTETTTNYAGTSAVTLNSTSTASATATATSNDFENNANTRAAAAAASAAYASSSITKNNVTTTGTISGGTTGILITSIATSTATATASSTADSDDEGITDSNSPNNETAEAISSAEAAAYSSAVIGGSVADKNLIRNTGSITATTYGISLRADSSATATATATAEADVEGNANTSVAFTSNLSAARDVAVATISFNEIANSGTVRVTAGNGIELVADADRITNEHFQATASVLNNSISNTGLIISSGDSIKLISDANDSNVTSATSTARVANNQVTNTGTIYALDDGIQIDASSADLRIAEDNTLTNTYPGRIVAKSNAVEIDTTTVRGNVLNNSGLLVSDTNMTVSGASLVKGTAYGFNTGTATTNTGSSVKITGAAGGTNNVVNLSAPSYVAGQFEFGRTAEVNVNLASGISHSVRWVFDDNDTSGRGAEAFTTSGLVPWFSRPTASNVQNGTPDEFATIDPSAFAAAPNQLADLSGLVSSVASEGLNRTGIERNGLWLSVRGSKMDYDSDKRATMEQRTRVESAAIGIATDYQHVRFAIFAGYSDGRLKVGSLYPDLYLNSYDNRAEGGFLGIHTQATMGAVKLQFGLSAGVLDHDDKRFVNDNLQWWGESYARSKYDSSWYSPEITLSVPLALSNSVSLTPTIHGRYAAQKFDRYTETGSNANATVFEHTVKIAELRGGLELKKVYDGGSTAALSLGYLQRDLHGNESVRVTMIGDTKQVPYFTQELHAGFAGLAFNLALSKAVSVKFDANYVNGSQGEGGNAGIALHIKY